MPKVYFEWDREPRAIVFEVTGKREPLFINLHEIDKDTLDRWNIVADEYQKVQEEIEQFLKPAQ